MEHIKNIHRLNAARGTKSLANAFYYISTERERKKRLCKNGGRRAALWIHSDRCLGEFQTEIIRACVGDQRQTMSAELSQEIFPLHFAFCVWED